jgi:hypothetical protein
LALSWAYNLLKSNHDKYELLSNSLDKYYDLNEIPPLIDLLLEKYEINVFDILPDINTSELKIDDVIDILSAYVDADRYNPMDKKLSNFDKWEMLVYEYDTDKILNIMKENNCYEKYIMKENGFITIKQYLRDNYTYSTFKRREWFVEDIFYLFTGILFDENHVSEYFDIFLKLFETDDEYDNNMLTIYDIHETIKNNISLDDKISELEEYDMINNY